MQGEIYQSKIFQGQDFKEKKGLGRQFREFFLGSVGLLVEPHNFFFWPYVTFSLEEGTAGVICQTNQKDKRKKK